MSDKEKQNRWEIWIVGLAVGFQIGSGKEIKGLYTKEKGIRDLLGWKEGKNDK